jgi:CheY-like chemotaxis protein/nitrogen-specific signal transduction histidine kinase
MARSRSKAKSVAKAARRRSSRRAGAARAHEAALAAFAHDIRTALTGILALGELLASSTLGKNERSWAAGIKASAEHLASLTTLVLDAAKAETGSLTLREEVFRPRRLVEFLVDSLATRAQAKGLAAEANIADNLPDLLVGDAVRLRAALENLIDNAVKFTERGAVRLEARASPAGRGLTRLVVAVHDSGIGLKPAEIKRLFRPFAQASAEIARHYGGSGLGLAIVKRLAKLMGGDLTVASTPGRGSSVRFTAVMPIVSADAAGSPSGRATPARPLAILCAEDNPYGRVILNTILTELGHRADFVNSGEDAVAAVTRGYDFVLMDVAFPGIDGLEAARRIRALPGVAGRTPIVGISGASEARDEEATRAAGMDFYLRKPVSPSAVSEAIAAVVSRNKD